MAKTVYQGKIRSIDRYWWLADLPNMLLLEWNYDPNRLHKSPIHHLLARLKGEAGSYIEKEKQKQKQKQKHAREGGSDFTTLRWTWNYR